MVLLLLFLELVGPLVRVNAALEDAVPLLEAKVRKLVELQRDVHEFLAI